MSKSLLSRYPCDMHCHTVRSDGHDTPQALIDNAAAAGMFAVGITDHDVDPPLTITLDDGREVDSMTYAAERGVALVLGDEFSTDTWVEDVHIIGYGLDWEHAELRAEVLAAAHSKTAAYEELCRRLTALGMPVAWETDVLRFQGPDGNLRLRRPDEVQRKHVFEAMAAKGYAPSWSAAKLMVQSNPELNVRRRKIGPIEAIHLIHRCGGIAVLAHPYLIDRQIHSPEWPNADRADYIDALIESGLDGIEARYTYDKTTYTGELTVYQIEAEIRARYAGRVRFFSGGSDYHADHKMTAKQSRSLGEQGLTIAEYQTIWEPECNSTLAVRESPPRGDVSTWNATTDNVRMEQ